MNEKALGDGVLLEQRRAAPHVGISRCWPFVVLLGSFVLSASASEDEVARTVVAQKQRWAESLRSNDPKLIAPLLAERIVATDEGLVLNGREAVLANQKSSRWSDAQYTEVKVTVFGGTAIAIGRFSGSGIDQGGKAFVNHGRFTDTWVKMPSGQWQCVATHYEATGA